MPERERWVWERSRLLLLITWNDLDVAKVNKIALARPNKPHMEGPKTAAEEMKMMRNLYQQMVLDKAGIKGDAPVQIGGLKRTKKETEVSATV